jgi:phage terminase large subunit-like protein
LRRQERDRRTATRKINSYFPDAGPLRRELYPRHMEFFAAGPEHRERLMLAANRVGKTEGVGGYELTLHLTGQYPDWWKGRRFDKPIRAWAAGDTSKTVREIIQFKLLGPVGSWGTGLIPGDSIERTVRAAGVADTVEVIYVKHKAGGVSYLVLKSYDQRRESFQGTEQDVVWLDEEPPLDIYTECLLRTMTNNGMLLCTFTPLLGMSEVVLLFLPGGRLIENLEAPAPSLNDLKSSNGHMEVPSAPSNGLSVNGGPTAGKVGNDGAEQLRHPKPARFVVMATWDDAPHLSEEAKKELWGSIPPFQRDARSKGIPQLGAGAIYPVPETDLLVAPFAIPDYWPRGYGMDVGWNCTAAIWGALDRQSDTLYLYREYARSQAEPSIHVHGIKAVGDWIPGFIDPASRGRSQKDGSQLLSDYRALGLKLNLADNGVESGLYSVWNRMSTGRLKVFNNLQGWLQEFRLYRRNEKGAVVKDNDHRMDAMRYLESRISSFQPVPPPQMPEISQEVFGGQMQQGWMR